ncbi:rhomboid family intramembrane serine protease [Mobiluncus mulieris]|uniref:rhomboid family intramembrane serine protease n=1 Tax=Mobiluncus mulieris TaxID=2052 RepID=UPI00242D5D61|nr:rhomboid family intramembrane serine protease [Mobiluncus mulieris]
MSESESYSENTRAPKPPKSFVTWGLCLAMLVIWVATLLFPTLIRDFAFMPAAALFEPWRFLSAAFLHSIPMPFHLGFNCWALWVVGRALEPIMGHTKLLLSFVICALTASLACCLTALLNLQAWLTFTVGASGAVFGFFGIMLAIQRMLRLPYTEMAALIGINFVIGFVLPNVAWVAHLGGLAAGLAIGGFTAWRLRHATLVEIPVHEVPTPDNPNPPKAVVLHRVITTRDRMYDVLFYAGFVLLLLGASWLFYHFNYHTIYSLLGF